MRLVAVCGNRDSRADRLLVAWTPAAATASASVAPRPSSFAKPLRASEGGTGGCAEGEDGEDGPHPPCVLRLPVVARGVQGVQPWTDLLRGTLRRRERRWRVS